MFKRKKKEKKSTLDIIHLRVETCIFAQKVSQERIKQANMTHFNLCGLIQTFPRFILQDKTMSF